MMTESVENYLTEILRLEETGDQATTSVLADRLHVARPSVTGMLKRLADAELVDHERYRGARLTVRGRRVALAVIRRHRLVETFLVDILGMAEHRVHEEAHRLEHALSDDVVDRLDMWLGRPRQDPHGRPIPGPANRRRRSR
jgi:DtxR family Mn-dependent transcriptional regulator